MLPQSIWSLIVVENFKNYEEFEILYLLCPIFIDVYAPKLWRDKENTVDDGREIQKQTWK